MSNERVECTFLWFIENYSYCKHKNGERLRSPTFTVNGLEGSAWYLSLYPRGEREDDKGYISLFLFNCANTDAQKKVLVDFELSFLAPNEPRIFRGKRELRRNFGFGLRKFLQLDEIRLRRKEDYLPNDTLTVRCKIWMGEGSVRKVAPIIVRTHIAIEFISFCHLVNEFSEFQSNQRKTIKMHSHAKKECIVLSNVYCCEGKIFLEIKPSDNNYILFKRKISLLDGSGNLIGCGEDDIRLDDERKGIQNLNLPISKHDILTNKEKYLADDRLTLLCECGFSAGLTFEKMEGSQYEKFTTYVDVNKSTAVGSGLSKKVVKNMKTFSTFASGLEDIKSLYINQCLTDVELKTETSSFKAHKLVLCVRSPVFSAILTTDMKAKLNNCIHFVALEDEIVQQFLLFLYSDNIENLNWNNAIKLYYAADKYQIGGLKGLCSNFLAENLSTSNVTELLQLANTYNDTDIKKLVEDFILQHEEQIFRSKEWEKFMEVNPLLAVKIMHLKYTI